MNWRQGKLEDLVFFQRGYDITKAAQKPGPYPVISSSGTTSYHNEFMVNGPGVIIGRKGSLGTVYYSSEDYWPHDTTLWSKDFRGNDPQFVYYFVHTLGLSNFDVGGANPTLNRNHIHKLDVLIPPLLDQQKIAAILIAYDDLIAANRRRIQLLEESARLLYREWFVRLRFPGHETMPVRDGVPKGWCKTAFSSVAEFINGFAFKPAHLFNEGLPIVKIPELRDGVSDTTPRNPGSEIPVKYRINTGDLLFSWSATLLVNEWSEGLALLNQDLFKVIPKLLEQKRMIRFALEEAIPKLLGQSVGATMQHIRRGALDNNFILMPDDQISQSFAELVDPLMDQVLSMQAMNRGLIKARDLLLPKLMSGALDVSRINLPQEVAA